MKNTNVRQRTFYSNSDIKNANYKSVFIFQYNDENDEPVKIKKDKDGKEKLTVPAKKILNDKKSKMYFDLLVKGNFDENDYFITLTYSEKYLPNTEAEAEAQIKKYIKDLRKEAKKRGVKILKYIYVTENVNTGGRIHHHLLLKKCLPRELIENLWSKQARPFCPDRERIGWANAKRIQIVCTKLKGKNNNPDYMIRISRYLTKETKTRKGQKKWKQSTGLVLPGTSKADNVCSKKQFEQMTLYKAESFETSNTELIKYVKRNHKGFVISDIRREYNEFTGKFYISMKLMKRKIWLKAMNLNSVPEQEAIKAADRFMKQFETDYKRQEMQGALW